MGKSTDDSLAQPVEHIPFKDGVLGSNPRRITKTADNDCYQLFSFYPYLKLEQNTKSPTLPLYSNLQSRQFFLIFRITSTNNMDRIQMRTDLRQLFSRKRDFNGAGIFHNPPNPL